MFTLLMSLTYRKKALQLAPFFLISLGFILRARQYLFQRNFWLDEAGFILNLQEKSYIELLSPLGWDKICPIGFLWLQKFMGDLFGYSELSMRFIPFIVGISILPTSYNFIKMQLGRKQALIVLLFGTLSTYLIYYSNEARKYELEVFLTILIYIFWKKQNKVIGFILISIVSTLFTHSSIFILASLLSFEFLLLLKNELKIKTLIIKHSGWIISFLLVYTLTLYNHPLSEVMKEYHSKNNAFIPHSNFTESIIWLWISVKRLFVEPLGLSLTGGALIFFTIGLISQFHSKKTEILIWLLPILFSLITAALELYPFGNRFSLFLFLPLAFLLSEGIVSSFNSNKIYIGVTVLILNFNPILENTKQFLKPENKENIKPLIQSINSVFAEGDKIILSLHTESQFRIYNRCLMDMVFKEQDLILSPQINSKDNFNSLINSIQFKKRIFVLINHDYPIEKEFSTQDKIILLKSQFELEDIKTSSPNTFLITLKHK